MGVKGWLVGGTLCSLVLALGCTKTVSETQAVTQTVSQEKYEDERISNYLSDICVDGMERQIVFLPDKDEIINITKDAEIAAVYSDTEKLSEILLEKDNVVEAHCHNITYDTLVQLAQGNDERLLMYDILGRDIVSRRVYEEYPSPARRGERGYLVGDMHGALLMQKFFYRFHTEGRLEHRILIMYENGDNRIIGYGFKGDSALQLQKIAKTYEDSVQNYKDAEQRFVQADDGDNLETLAMQRSMNMMGLILGRTSGKLSDKYSKIIRTYFESHCKPWEVTECLEPDFCEFMVDVNLSEGIFIEDRGFFMRPKKH